jgi:DNA-binding winged helix-turn-helix (wHTH) protein
MLAVLALEAGQAVSHTDLADELWSGDTVRNPRNALQAHATRVRRVLKGEGGRCGSGTTVLRSVPNGYVLDVPREHIDGHRFLDLASQAATTLADAPERALRLLDSALLLWRGPALLDAGDGLRCRSAARLFEERRLGPGGSGAGPHHARRPRSGDRRTAPAGGPVPAAGTFL